MRRKIICTALVLLCAAVFVVCLYQICGLLTDYRAGTEAYDGLRGYMTIEPETKKQNEQETGGAESPSEPAIRWPAVDFDSLRSINPECVGWIYCEGTEINYPVAQGQDNLYYLEHLFDGSENRSGCIFLSCGNSSDFSDFHSVIYGHHMKNDTMFSGLTKYKEQTYFEEHPVMLLMTPEENFEIRLFAGYVASLDDNAWQSRFQTQEDQAAWLRDICAKSCFESDLIPETTDRILTLSTCSYEFQDARFVLFGILKDS